MGCSLPSALSAEQTLHLCNTLSPDLSLVVFPAVLGWTLHMDLDLTTSGMVCLGFLAFGLKQVPLRSKQD